MFNLGDNTATVTANWSDLGFTGDATVRNLWARADAGTSANSVSRTLLTHESALFKVTPTVGSTILGGPLTSASSGRCADSPGGTTVNATQLVVWDCNGGENQKVTYSGSTKTLNVLYKCFDAHAGGTSAARLTRCWKKPTGGTSAGTHVELYDCNGGTNQQWNVNADGTITGAQSGLCLDVSGATNPNGSILELWTCNGGANQRWTLGNGVRIP